MIGLLLDLALLVISVGPIVFAIALMTLLRREEDVPLTGRDLMWACTSWALFAAPLVLALVFLTAGVPQDPTPWQLGLLAVATAVAALLAWTFDDRQAVRSPGFAAYAGAMLLVLGQPLYWVSEIGTTNFLASYDSETRDAAMCPASGAVLFVHVSDVHASTLGETADGMSPGQQYVGDLDSALTPLSPGVVLVTGDVTDTGSVPEWTTARQAFAPIRRRMPVVLAPGNHDLVSWYEPTRSGNGRDADYYLRVARFAEAQVELDPALRTAADIPLIRVVEQLRPTVAAIEERRAARQENCRRGCELARDIAATEQVGRGGTGPAMSYAVCLNRCAATDHRQAAEDDLVSESWQRVVADMFPLVRRFPDQRLAVLVLNSVPVTSVWRYGASAVGGVDEGQLRRLRAVLDVIPRDTRMVVIAMHHPPFRGPTRQPRGPDSIWSPLGWYNSEWWAYAFLRIDYQSARALADTLAEFKERRPETDVVVAYGHRHVRRLSEYRRLPVLEAGAIRDRHMYAALDGTPRLRIADCRF